MDLMEMIEEIKKIPLLQLQEKHGNFFGAVVANRDLNIIEQLLNTFFGQPLKPVNVEVNEEIANLTNPYGGVRQNQVFYYRKDTNEATLAMLWPWSDNQRFTLKIIREIPERIIR